MTGWNGMQPRLRFDSEDDLCMLDLWQMGMDTLDIARAMCRPESEIANRLPHVLLASRQDAEWNQAATA